MVTTKPTHGYVYGKKDSEKTIKQIRIPLFPGVVNSYFATHSKDKERVINMSIQNLTIESFDKVIKTGNVLVDFWAGWCMPCTMLAPTIEQLSKEYSGKLSVAKVDIDAEGDLAMRYSVMSIPTVILFKDGAEANRFIGVQPKEIYVEELNKL